MPSGGKESNENGTGPEDQKAYTRWFQDLEDASFLCRVPSGRRGACRFSVQDDKEAGKARAIGYSGDNEAAAWAVESGLFDTLQTSFNLVDQQARSRLFAGAEEQGAGIIAKRSIANAAWGPRSRLACLGSEVGKISR